MTPPRLCPLIDADRTPGCGAKAARLATMLRLGLPVPPGVVLTDAAFQEFIDHNKLRSSVEAVAAAGDCDSLVRRAAELRAQVMAAEVPAAVVEELRSARPAAPWAVRSSALGEDSTEASFAGQLDSFLGMESDADLEQAIRACWASYWSERVLLYQLSRGVRLGGMGVIVQRLAPARFAGVLFTRAPGANGATMMLIEFCPGLGDALVSGRTTPGRIVLARDGGRCLERAPCDGADDFPGPETISCLVRAAQVLEKELGAPQDIEWAVGPDERLALLQTRPITGAVSPTAPRVVWSNANVNENFPKPVTPLLYSVAALGYYHYFRNLAVAFGFDRGRVEAMEEPLRHLIGTHAGRIYYNLTNIHAVLRQAPFGEALAASFNSFVGTTATAPAARPRWGRRVVELVRVAFQTARQFLFLSRRVAQFERTVQEFANRTEPADLQRRPLLALRDDLRGFLAIRSHWTDAALADAASMVTYGALKHLLRRDFPEEESSALHNTLLKGLADVVGHAGIVRLWEMSRLIRENNDLQNLFAGHNGDELLARLRQAPEAAAFVAAFDDYLRQWGYRRSGELMLTVPSFDERPAELLDLVRVYAARDGDSPAEQLQRQVAERAAETQRVLTLLRRRKLVRFLPWPTRATVVRVLLRWARTAIAGRERARLKQALLYNRLRRIALAIGDQLVEQGRLTEREEIFFLTFTEIDDLLSGTAMFPDRVRELVRLRRQAHASFAALRPPDTLELPEGAYYDAAAEASPVAEAVNGDGVLRGVGACGGLATGRAAVLADVSEFGRLREGDILVTRQTDPGWGPVFPLIRGLVIERGGMLSHGAIIAREYGIPAVVGVAEASRRLATGQTITVDGDRGCVHVRD